MENFNKNKNPTIYSIVSTHYYIQKLINLFYSWSCAIYCESLLQANLCAQIICNKQEHEKTRSTVYPIQGTLFCVVKNYCKQMRYLKLAK